MPNDARLRRYARFAGIGLCVLVAADVFSRAAHGPAGFIGLQVGPLAALALAGLSLALQVAGRLPRAATAAAGLAAGLGLLGLAESLAGVDSHFDRWVGLQNPASLSGSLVAAAAGLALLVNPLPGRNIRLVTGALVVFITGVAGSSLVSAAFTPPDSGTLRADTFGPAAAFLFIALALGIACSRPEVKAMRILGAPTAAGMLARRLLFLVLVQPALLSLLLAYLLRHALFTPAEGLTVFAMTGIVSGIAIALLSAREVFQLEEQREEADEALNRLNVRLQQQAAQLQETVAARTLELSEANTGLRAAVQANARLALVASHTTNGVVITDAQGRIEWANAAHSRLTGAAPTEAAGRDAAAVLAGSGATPATLERLRRAIATGERCTLEILGATRGGGPRAQLVNLEPIRDRDGTVINFIAIETDLTEQHLARRELALLNERLQLALRSTNFGVWELELGTNRLIWDERMHVIYGLDRATFTGDREVWIRALHPDDREQAQEVLRRVLSQDLPSYDTTFRIVTASGEIRHIEAHGYLHRSADGTPQRLVGLNRDITAERRLQAALDLAEQRWQLALEGSNDAVWDWNLQTGDVYHDAQWARMLGYRPEEVAPGLDGWRTLVHPDDLPACEEAIQEHLGQRTAYYFQEYRMRSVDGGWKWILDRGKVVTRAADGRALRMVGTHSDITSRKQLEQRLRQVEELAAQVSRLAQIGGWELDLETSRLAWSSEARRIYGLDDEFQPTLTAILGFYPPDARATFESALEKTMLAGTPFDLELPLDTPAGRRIWVRVIGDPELRNGQIVGVQGAIQDITARHESDEARRQLETQLFQAQKMETLGTLAGGIAHDFNNLLTGIIGYNELAADSVPADNPAHACLIEARNAGMRARELVEQILTFGRQSSGEAHSPVDLTVVIDEARRFLRATLPASVTIETEVAPRCPLVLADATQIHQVILNLGSNAAHAMRHSGGRLHISLQPSEIGAEQSATLGGVSTGGYVRLSVADTGHGMDEATLRRVFDPFFTTKNTREGTGLGLAVVHGIVRAHHGAIDVQSKTGVGSTFHIYLPAAPSADGPAKPGQPSTVLRGRGEIVFVVDDEEIVGRCTQLTLESRGYQAVAFGSAEECLRRLRDNPTACQAVVTDQTMPGMQGTELAATLRRLTPSLPIVIMSGYFSKVSPHVIDELGPVELLAKPFTPEELVQTLDRALHPGNRGPGPRPALGTGAPATA